MKNATQRVTPRRFQKTGGVQDWRLRRRRSVTYFRTGSFVAGARLVHVISELADLEAHQPDVDLRYGRAGVVGARDAEDNEACVATFGWIELPTPDLTGGRSSGIETTVLP